MKNLNVKKFVFGMCVFLAFQNTNPMSAQYDAVSYSGNSAIYISNMPSSPPAHVSYGQSGGNENIAQQVKLNNQEKPSGKSINSLKFSLNAENEAILQNIFIPENAIPIQSNENVGNVSWFNLVEPETEQGEAVTEEVQIKQHSKIHHRLTHHSRSTHDFIRTAYSLRRQLKHLFSSERKVKIDPVGCFAFK